MKERAHGLVHGVGCRGAAPDPPSALVVDDDPLVRRALTRQLVPDFRVHQAHSALQALALLAAMPRIDLALVDFELSDGTGAVVLYRLRRWPRAVRILMSGNGRRLAAPGRCGRWAHLVLRKPVPQSSLDVVKRAALKLALET